MSMEILYHGFGFYGCHYTRAKYQQGALVFSSEKEPTSLRCPCCKGLEVKRKRTDLQWFYTLPKGGKQVYVAVAKSHVPGPWHRLSDSLGFADARRTYTRAFQCYVFELSKTAGICRRTTKTPSGVNPMPAIVSADL